MHTKDNLIQALVIFALVTAITCVRRHLELVQTAVLCEDAAGLALLAWGERNGDRARRGKPWDNSLQGAILAS